ncbi:MAG: hypothetical protein COT88_01210 [Candidatus Colwellbacteria bacterium CG10_big_fil_rev_8_21_14_0_10_41_28]|uniref:HTH HARE-type domain-containing protein n=1 Tax=Candidatus Colwellbacteria bacterium CG10_big_fil_rev_8_21_14_0_10_41_28 TaxID=1974539 RepID=A0A2H0VH53_9BACT|nr:MAG: hypothetical protein COT88_01210 [Candidatus Colwellbacteria bacterium CG10_big_fil_rev_8_21_14_0_10_41_28]
MIEIAVKLDIDELIRKALQAEDKRARDILVRRFGLKTPEKYTLASLGDEYGLTRERVRQIEAATLKSVRNRIIEEEEVIAFLKLVENYLEGVANLRRSDLLARDFAMLSGYEDGYHTVFENKLVFLAKALGNPYIVDETQDMYTVWHNDKEVHGKAKDFVDSLINSEKHDFDHVLRQIIKEHELPESTILNYLSISKNFGIGPYGHLGADHWVHINPKTVKDMAYLVLLQNSDPMHFREIAEEVNKMSDKKRAHATVHNELIRDDRFKLFGRGTYSLNE